MEPKILIIGAIQSNLDSVAARLKERGRDILITNYSEERIQELLTVQSVDFVILEPNQQPTINLIRSIDRKMEIHAAELSNWQALNLLIDKAVKKFKESESELLTVEK